jgi:ribulose 1,5-bisphosphate synthetase/thiazole synthase
MLSYLWSITSFREAEVLVVGASLAGLCAAYSTARPYGSA